MAIDFPRSTYTAAEGVSAESWPASPSNGDTQTNGAGDDFTFNGTSSLWVLDTGRTLTLSGGATYSWDGEKWIAQSHIPFRYFGPQSTDPTGLSADNEGDLYFNTVENEMRVYNGSSWDSLSAVDVLSDTSPQLGGDLDVNSNTITGLPDAPSVNSEASSKKYVDDQIAGLDTDLTYTASTRVLASSTGTNATLPEVVASGDSGLMTGADKNKLDNVAASANNYSHPNHSGDVTSTGDGATVIANNAVTYAKMQDLVTANRVLGGTSTGDISEVQVATDMIADDAVTSAKIEANVVLTGDESITVPIGTTEQRPTAVAGMIRYNSTTEKFEGATGSTAVFGSIGGGATGGGSDAVFIENGNTVNNDYEIPENTNAGSFGPITIASGQTVEIPATSNWTIV